jgi:hypothetical protein
MLMVHRNPEGKKKTCMWWLILLKGKKRKKKRRKGTYMYSQNCQK